jgi:fibronectin-binding autotransporter adhesin
MVLAMLLAAVAPAWAATSTWDGGGLTSNWTEAANWVGDVAPVGDGTDDLVFTGVVQTTANNDFPIGTPFKSIAITATGFNLTGNRVVLVSTATAISVTTGTSTIALPLTVLGSQTWSVTGTELDLSGSIDLTAYFLTVAAGTGTIRFQGVISGPSGALIQSSGTVYLEGASSNDMWGSTIRVDAGTMRLAKTGGAIAVSDVINVGTTTNGTATLVVDGSGQFSAIAVVTLGLTNDAAKIGVLDFNGNHATNTIGGLTCCLGGVVKSGANLTPPLLIAGNISGVAYDGGMTCANNITFTMPQRYLSINNLGNTGAINTVVVFSGVIDLGGHERTISASTTTGVRIDGTVSNGGLIKVNTGPVIINAAQPSLTGRTTVFRGTLQLIGGTGSLAGNVEVLPAGTFEITAAGAAGFDHLPDASTITLRGGTLKMGSPAGIDRSETVGQIVVANMNSTIDLTPNGAGNCVLATGANGISWTGGAELSLIRRSGGGAGVANLTATSGFTDQQQLPWSTTSDGTTAYVSKYDATLGVVADTILASPAVTKTSLADGLWNDGANWNPAGVPGSADVVSVGHNLTVAGADALAWSVAITAAKTISRSGSERLVVSSGRITTSNLALATISLPVTCGSTGSMHLKAVVGTAGTDTLTISGAITAAGLCKATQPGELILTGANTFTGATGLYTGKLTVPDQTFMPTGALWTGGTAAATLKFTGSSAASFANTCPVYLAQDTTFDAASGVTLAGTIELVHGTNSSVSITVSQTTASVAFTGNIMERGGCTVNKSGFGRLLLSGQNRYSNFGSNAGTVALGSSSAYSGGWPTSSPLGLGFVSWKPQGASMLFTVELVGSQTIASAAVQVQSKGTMHFTGAGTLTVDASRINNTDTSAAGYIVIDRDTTLTTNTLTWNGNPPGQQTTLLTGGGTLILNRPTKSNLAIVAGTVRLAGSATLNGTVTIYRQGAFFLDACGSQIAALYPTVTDINLRGGTWEISTGQDVSRVVIPNNIRVQAYASTVTTRPHGTGGILVNATRTAISPIPVTTPATLAVVRAANANSGPGTSTIRANVPGAWFTDDASLGWCTVDGSMAMYDASPSNLGLVPATGAAPASPATYTSNNAAGTWDTQAHWTPAAPVGGPASTDNVVIADGTAVSLNGANRSVNSVTMQGTSSITGANTLTVAGGTVTATGTATTTIACALKFGSAALGAVIDHQGTGRLTVSGAVSGGGNTYGIEKRGTGSVAFSGTNSDYGPTLISAGKFLANSATATGSGNQSVFVASGATLGGTGTVGGTSEPIQVAGGATIAPGDQDTGSVGTLTVPCVSTGNTNAMRPWPIAVTGSGTVTLRARMMVGNTSDLLRLTGNNTSGTNATSSQILSRLALVTVDTSGQANGTWSIITSAGTPTIPITPSFASATLPTHAAVSYATSTVNVVKTNNAPTTVSLTSPVDCPDAGVAGPTDDLIDTNGRTFNRRAKLVWAVPTDVEGDAIHFTVSLDQVDGSTQVADSATSQTGFSWYNGSAWVAFPAGGATSGTGSVRYTPQADLAADAASFWTVVASDGIVSSTAWPVRRFVVASSAWTDPTLTAAVTRIRKIHLDELRTEANRIRLLRGLGAATWTDTITADQTLIRAVHFTELRTALSAVDALTGTAVTTWSEAIGSGGIIKADHITELRSAITGL